MLPTPSLLTMLFFFFNDTATTEIYTLSLHDALPISPPRAPAPSRAPAPRDPSRRSAAADPAHHGHAAGPGRAGRHAHRDRKSTRLNSSHLVISYAVFCLKKKKKKTDSRHARRLRSDI